LYPDPGNIVFSIPVVKGIIRYYIYQYTYTQRRLIVKKLSLIFSVILLTGIFFLGCQDNQVTNPVSGQLNRPIGTTDYDVVLVGGAPINNNNGTWTWTWTITNTNPGNGTNSTQNLSHWDLVPSICGDPSKAFSVDDIVLAETSLDGSDWDEFTPVFMIDPSIENKCGPSTYSELISLKFNLGTEGGNPSYYRLTVNKDFEVDPSAMMIYASGITTGCGTGYYDGIGCEKENKCYKYETAWGGKDSRFVSKGNWATYFNIPSTAVVTRTLFAGQTLPIGSIKVENTGGNNFKATYTASAGYAFKELHFAYGNTIPWNSNPSPGLFPKKIEFEVPVTEHYFEFTYNGFPFNVAAHAVVQIEIPCP
jgi:hypothetical protein